jgi:hypothetical protein
MDCLNSLNRELYLKASSEMLKLFTIETER